MYSFFKGWRLRGPSVTIAYRVEYDQFSGSLIDRCRVFQGPPTVLTTVCYGEGGYTASSKDGARVVLDSFDLQLKFQW